jgi:hypothetical protein
MDYLKPEHRSEKERTHCVKRAEARESDDAAPLRWRAKPQIYQETALTEIKKSPANVLGNPFESCALTGMTGFYRDGFVKPCARRIQAHTPYARGCHRSRRSVANRQRPIWHRRS